MSTVRAFQMGRSEYQLLGLYTYAMQEFSINLKVICRVYFTNFYNTIKKHSCYADHKR